MSIHTLLKEIRHIKENHSYFSINLLTINRDEVKCCFPYGMGDQDSCLGISVSFGNEDNKIEHIYLTQINGLVSREIYDSNRTDIPTKEYDFRLYEQDWIKIYDQLK